MTGFGEKLKQERETRGISLEEVAEATRVRRCYLEALEADNFEELPGTVFNKGYVRAYANFIGADPETFVDAYLAEERAQQGDVEVERQDVLKALSKAVDRAQPREIRAPVIASHLLSRLIVPALVFGGLAIAGWFLFRDLPPNEQAAEIARRGSPSNEVVESVRSSPPTSESDGTRPSLPKATPAGRDASLQTSKPAAVGRDASIRTSKPAADVAAARPAEATDTAAPASAEIPQVTGATGPQGQTRPTSTVENALSMPPPPKAVPTKRGAPTSPTKSAQNEAAAGVAEPTDAAAVLPNEIAQVMGATGPDGLAHPLSTVENALSIPPPPKAVPTKRGASTSASKPAPDKPASVRDRERAFEFPPPPKAAPARRDVSASASKTTRGASPPATVAASRPTEPEPTTRIAAVGDASTTTTPPAEPTPSAPRPASPPTATPPPSKATEEPVARVAPARTAPIVQSASHLSIDRYGVGSKVVDRRLVGQSDRFSVGSRVYFWTNVSGGRQGDRIRHVWLYKGAAIQSNRLGVGASTWRTHSYKTMTLSRVGPWAVEARDADGNVLARETFVCVEK